MTQGNYPSFVRKIDEFIRKYYLNRILRGAIYLASSFFAAYLLIAVAEYYGHFDPIVRTILFYAFIIINLFIFVNYIFLPFLSYLKLGKSINYEQASVIIGDHFKPFKDKLLNTLQLKKLSDQNPEHQLLIEASIDQKIAELQPLPFVNAVRIGENKKYLKYALAPLVAIILILFTAPSIFSESTERLLKHNTRFVKNAPFNFVLSNKDLTAVQGDDFQLNLKLVGDQIPQDVYVEDGVNTYKLEKQSIIKFSYTFKNLQKDKKIRFIAGEYGSELYTIEVKVKPSLLKFKAYLDYPSYLNKQDETVDNTGDLTVPAGTNIRWTFEAKNTDKLFVRFDSAEKPITAADEKSFSFTHRALNSMNYSVRAANQQLISSDSISYLLNVTPDLHPTIAVTDKADSVNSHLLYFVGQVNDDYGFSKLQFNYRVLGSQSTPSKTVSKVVPISKQSNQSSFFHLWDAGLLEANPGDQIEYYFEIYDNDGVTGPKVTRSAVKMLKLLSEKEVEEKLQAGTNSIKTKMDQAIKQATEVEREAKKLNQDLLNKKSLNYEDKKQLEKLLDKQKQLENLVKNIQDENKQNLYEQQENKEIREDILEKQKQIEDLFNNVLDEQTREILRNLEKLLEQNNKNLTQDELSKMQVDNKSLKKELDRILELYKQLEFEQKLIETAEKLGELAKDQQQLSQESKEKGADLNQLKKEQQKLKEEFQSLKENLKELESKNEDLDQKNDFKNDQEEQEEIEKDQEESSKSLDKKDAKKASENQRQAAEKMTKLSQKLESMQQAGEEEENAVNIQNLREILDNLIKTSFDQEKIMLSLKTINSVDPSYISNTQKQKDIKDDLKMIEDSLYSLSKKVPQIQSVVNKEIQSINLNVNNSLENLAERRTAEANRNQQYAMTSINNLALMLSEALDQMQKAQQNAKSGGKGKKKQSLSQLSKMQDQLNKNMQKAREQMHQQGEQGQQGKQGQGKNPMSEQLAKMAREQQLIRQGMQEINRELNKDGKSGLGNLDQLMKEMEQTETDLVNKKIYQETINRQQEILTKLLEAEKADREREQDNQRESKQGIDRPSNANQFMKEFNIIKQKEIELLKTVPPSLNSFYKIKVGDYFKFLNSGNNDN